MGNWNYGSYKTSSKPYVHRKHVKSSKNSDGDVFDTIAGFLLLGSLVFAVFVYLDIYNWDIVSLVVSNLGPLLLLIIIVAVFIRVYIFFDNL